MPRNNPYGFIRLVKDGQIHVKYLGCTFIEKADASGIVAGLKRLVEENLEADFTNFIKSATAVTTDGASVMLGRKSGVTTGLKEVNEHLFGNHCMAGPQAGTRI